MHAFTAAIQVPILPARTKSRSRTANKTTAPSTVDYHQSTTCLTNRWCHHYPNTINQPKYPNSVMAVHDSNNRLCMIFLQIIWLAVTYIFSMHIYASCQLQCGQHRKRYLFFYTILAHKIRCGRSLVKWVKKYQIKG